MRHQTLQRLAIGIASFLFIVLMTACAGVANTGQVKNFTGSLSSFSAANHSVTLSVNGQSVTINGLNDQEVSELQAQASKISSISLQATQNSDGSYTIAAGQNSITITFTNGTSITFSNNGTPAANGTPGTNGNNGTPGPNEPGSISFTGTVKSVSSTSIVVNMPDGSTLPMAIVNGQTNLEDFNGALPSFNQLIKVEASANISDGSFTATKLKKADSNDNTVDFQGVTTSAVGADHVIHFRIGNRDFSFAIASNAKLDDFNGNAQAIGNTQNVKVTVQFQGTTGTASEVKNGNS